MTYNASWWRNNGRRWPRTDLREEQRKQRAGQRRKTKMTGGEKGQKRIKHRIFFVIFNRSSSHRNSRGWVTEWLFYYVADWPQPSNILTCMCGGFLQALLLIISVLLVTFSFSHSSFSLNRINTLYLDTPLFVFPSYKTCLCFTENKNHTWCLLTVSLWLLFISFYFIIINVVVLFGSAVGVVTYSCFSGACIVCSRYLSSASGLIESGHVKHITSCTRFFQDVMITWNGIGQNENHLCRLVVATRNLTLALIVIIYRGSNKCTVR